MKKGLLITAVLALVFGMALVSCTQDSNLDIVEVKLNLDDSVSRALEVRKTDSAAITGYAIKVTPTAPTYYSYSSIGTTDYTYVAVNNLATFLIKLSRGEWTFSVIAYSDSDFDGSVAKATKKFAEGSVKQKINGNDEVTVNLAPAATNNSDLTIEFEGVEVVSATDNETRIIIRKENSGPYAVDAVVKDGENEVINSSSFNRTESTSLDIFNGIAVLKSCSAYQKFYVVYQENRKTYDSENDKWSDNWVDTTKKQLFGVNMYDGIRIKLNGALTAEGSYTTNRLVINGVTVSVSLTASGRTLTATVTIPEGSGTIDGPAVWSISAFDAPVASVMSEPITDRGTTSSSASYDVSTVYEGLYYYTVEVPVTIGGVEITASQTASFEWDGSSLSASEK